MFQFAFIFDIANGTVIRVQLKLHLYPRLWRSAILIPVHFSSDSDG